jgi:hypothetical protein
VISCVSELENEDPKILFDEMRFIDPFACWALFPSACLPLLNTMPRALHEIPPGFWLL